MLQSMEVLTLNRIRKLNVYLHLHFQFLFLSVTIWPLAFPMSFHFMYKKRYLLLFVFFQILHHFKCFCFCCLSTQIISNDCVTVNTSAVTSASAAMRTPRRWFPAEFWGSGTSASTMSATLPGTCWARLPETRCSTPMTSTVACTRRSKLWKPSGWAQRQQRDGRWGINKMLANFGCVKFLTYEVYLNCKIATLWLILVPKILKWSGWETRMNRAIYIHVNKQ